MGATIITPVSLSLRQFSKPPKFIHLKISGPASTFITKNIANLCPINFRVSVELSVFSYVNMQGAPLIPAEGISLIKTLKYLCLSSIRIAPFC